MNLLFSGSASGPLQQGISIGISVLVVAFALVTCFFGYKLLKVWTTIMGFIVGLAIGGILAFYFSKQNLMITLIVAVVAGLILAALSFFLYKVGLFILVLYEGFTLLLSLLTSFFPEGSNMLFTILAVIGGIALGVIAILFVRPVVIIVTGLSGGSSIVRLLSGFAFITSSLIPLIVGAVIAIAGIVTQFTTTHKGDHER